MSDTPIFLSTAEHLDHIMGHGRLARMDRERDDVIFEENERMVAQSVMELELFPSEPRAKRPIDWTVARDLAAALTLNFAGLALGGYVLWQMLRPL